MGFKGPVRTAWSLRDSLEPESLRDSSTASHFLERSSCPKHRQRGRKGKKDGGEGRGESPRSEGWWYEAHIPKHCPGPVGQVIFYCVSEDEHLLGLLVGQREDSGLTSPKQ